MREPKDHDSDKDSANLKPNRSTVSLSTLTYCILALVGGSTYLFFDDWSSPAETIVMAILGGVGLAFLVMAFIELIKLSVNNSLDYAMEGTNPQSRWLRFIFMFCCTLCLIDWLIFQSTFIVGPAISLFAYGDLSETFWGCENWIIIDEGSFCNDE